MDLSVHQYFSKLISLVSAGANGNTYSDSINNWEYVCRIATEQAVLPLLGCALINNAKLECPDVYKNYILASMRDVSSKNIIRRQRITNLLQELEMQGFHVALLKGYALADCYEYPECRCSVDTDILVLPEEEKAVCDFLRKKEFIVTKRNPVSHHAVCRHKRYGMLEVHVGLYDDIVEDVWFQEKTRDLIQEDYVRINTPEGEYMTLGYTDHLIFLMLHMIKHFISNGISVGMMLDVALFWSKHQRKIDAQRVWTMLEELKFATFISCVLHALIRYGDFEASSFSGVMDVTDDQIDMFLADLERGGRMGIKDSEGRRDCAFAYGRMVMLRDKSKLQYWRYMLCWKAKNMYSALFPSKEHLWEKYPYIKQKPWLLPAAWLHRLVFRGTKALKNDRTGQQIRNEDTLVTQEVRERMDLFQKLGMI